MAQFTHRTKIARAIEKLRGQGAAMALERVLDQSALDAIEGELGQPASDDELDDALIKARTIIERSGRTDDTAEVLAALDRARQDNSAEIDREK